MNSAKDDDDYWNNSETGSFSFDLKEFEKKVDLLSDIRNNDDNDLLAGISNVSISENAKPLRSVIPEKTLSSILAADALQNLYPETVVQPDITLRKILLGQPYSLEQYKSLASKTALLDAAILSGDGNAILIVILFISKTLKRSLLQRLLVDRPDAVNVYIHYLFIRLKTNEITDILTMLGHPLDAAMKNLIIIIRNTKDPNRLLQKLRNCYKIHFSILSDCKETVFLQSYIKLLEWQIAVREKMYAIDEELTLNSTILESLHYAHEHHYDTPKNFVMMTPTTFSQDHDISSILYHKTALRVKASRGKWDEIDALLLTKGIVGNVKLQTCLFIEDILKILHKYDAPYALLEKYLKFVEDLEKRLELAKKLSYHTIVIDILVKQGNRKALMDYKAKLQSQSGDYFYAESALHLPHVKWKN